MFESDTRLRQDVVDILDSLVELGDGRYAAIFDSRALVAESRRGEEGAQALRSLVRGEAKALLLLPTSVARGERVSDPFESFEEDAFLLAVVNGKVGLLVACADASRLEKDSERLLRALVDRLLRLDSSWRYDEKGRGIFFGSPRLDTLVIPRPGAATDA